MFRLGCRVEVYIWGYVWVYLHIYIHVYSSCLGVYTYIYTHTQFMFGGIYIHIYSHTVYTYILTHSLCLGLCVGILLLLYYTRCRVWDIGFMFGYIVIIIIFRV